jgi:hypothetical protein
MNAACDVPPRSRFPTAAHLCSWARLAPGVKESAGKKKGRGSTGHGNPYLARVLGEAAAAAAAKTDTCGLDAIGVTVMVIAGQSSFPALGDIDQVTIGDSPKVDREGIRSAANPGPWCCGVAREHSTWATDSSTMSR